jgi:FkbM family methyltransferase
MRNIPAFLTKKPVYGKTYFGSTMLLNLREKLSWHIFATGRWETAESATLEKTLKTAHTFYDIGANIGYFSLMASNIIGSSGKVYAIEASPKNVSSLQQNILLNNHSNIIVYPYGLSHHTGSGLINQHAESGMSSFLPNFKTEEQYTVPLIPLDELIRAEHLQPPDVIKIDVEGMELDVIRGMKSTLSANRHITLLVEITAEFLESQGDSEIELYKILFDYGFRKSQLIHPVAYQHAGKTGYQTNVLFEKEGLATNAAPRSAVQVET